MARTDNATPGADPSAFPGKGQPFLADMKAIRERARRDMNDGAVTAGYGKDRQQAIQVLNAALATELICVLRYKRHSFMAVGIYAEPIADEFAQHAVEEQAHADYVECSNLREMIQENLVAERIAIDTYREMVRWFGDDDPTTKRMLESILSQEEEHADELADLLEKSQI